MTPFLRDKWLISYRAFSTVPFYLFHLSMTGFLSNQWYLLCIVFISIYQSLKIQSKVFLDASFIKKIQRINQGMQALMEKKKPARRKKHTHTLNGFSTTVKIMVNI